MMMMAAGSKEYFTNSISRKQEAMIIVKPGKTVVEGRVESNIKRAATCLTIFGRTSSSTGTIKV